MLTFAKVDQFSMIQTLARTPKVKLSTSVVERFITEACKEADAKKESVTDIIHERLSLLSELVGGYDFAK